MLFFPVTITLIVYNNNTSLKRQRTDASRSLNYLRPHQVKHVDVIAFRQVCACRCAYVFVCAVMITSIAQCITYLKKFVRLQHHDHRISPLVVGGAHAAAAASSVILQGYAVVQLH